VFNAVTRHAVVSIAWHQKLAVDFSGTVRELAMAEQRTVQQGDADVEALSRQAAKQALIAFSGAYKKLNLYSESHDVYRNALQNLQKFLEYFFRRFGSLALRIERDRILYDNETIYEGSSEPTDLVFVLHRDGILSIEFQEGLELWEIDTLLKILHEHCVLAEDAEDDIVTALWKFNLPSILYEAAELELGPTDELRLAPPPGVAEGDKEAVEAVEDAGERDPPVALTLVSPLAGRNELFQLTADESEQLRKMVIAEEQLDGADYVVDVLLYILEKHCLPDDVDDLLNTLLEELRDALRKGRFAYLHAVLVKLKNHLDALAARSHWSSPHMARFFASLAGETFLHDLLSISPPVDECAPESLEALRQFLLLLDKSAVATLGPMMVKTQSAALQRVLLETIAAMARQDLAPLEKLIRLSNADLAGRLVFILGNLNDEPSRKLLSKLLHHEAAAVRRQALKAILARDDQALEEIFALVHDPDEEILKLVLQRLGRERDAQAEILLLQHLEADHAGIDNDDRYMALFRALGRCGSDRSIPFIKTQLFRWPLLGVLRSAKSRQRRGAVIALEGLNTRRAAYLVQRSGRGVWGNLFRSA
jgi:hypothetical protein